MRMKCDARRKPNDSTYNKSSSSYSNKNQVTLRNDGILGDLAPTMLDLLGVEQPDEMTGKSLITK